MFLGNKSRLAFLSTVLIALVSMGGLQVFAGVQDGVMAFNAGNYKEAYNEFTAIGRDDPTALIYLARMYQNGLGVKQSYEAAEMFYIRAASNGARNAVPEMSKMIKQMHQLEHSRTQITNWFNTMVTKGRIQTQYEIAQMFDQGRFFIRNIEEAEKWYLRAASGGHAQAQHKIGTIYDRRNKVLKEWSKILDWMATSARMGLSQAEYLIGSARANGLFMEQNFDIAQKWFLRSAARGNVSAQQELKTIFNALTPTSTPAAREEEQQISGFETTKQSAVAGNTESMFELASTYNDPESKHYDPMLAIRWFQEASDQSHTRATAMLAVLIQEGTGTQKDLAKAISLYKKAAQQNDALALYRLGLLYQSGAEGIEKDLQKAEDFFIQASTGNRDAQKALSALIKKKLAKDKTAVSPYLSALKEKAQNGIIEAQYQLGNTFKRGAGLDLDYAQAFFWFHKAAAQGHPAAQAELGTLYYHGHGTGRDYVKASMWLTLSSRVIRDTANSNILLKLNDLMTPDEQAEAKKSAKEWKPQQNSSPQIQ